MTTAHKPLSKNAQKIQQILTQKSLNSEVIELSNSTRTAQDAANTIGCDIGQIIKSLLFCTAQSHQPVLILASGINRVNEKCIQQWLGEKVSKATAEFAREITGFAIGGVPPLGHKQKIEHIFIDRDLLQYEILWAAAGTPYAVFSLPSSHIQSLTGGQLISIK